MFSITLFHLFICFNLFHKYNVHLHLYLQMEMLNVNVNGFVGIEVGRCSTPTNLQTTCTSTKSSSLRLDKDEGGHIDGAVGGGGAGGDGVVDVAAASPMQPARRVLLEKKQEEEEGEEEEEEGEGEGEDGMEEDDEVYDGGEGQREMKEEKSLKGFEKEEEEEEARRHSAGKVTNRNCPTAHYLAATASDTLTMCLPHTGGRFVGL